MSRTTTTTEPYLIDLLSVDLHVGGKRVFTAEVENVGVTVEFDYTPGEPGRTWGRMEDAEEAIAAEVEIRAVRPALMVVIETGEYAAVVINANADIRDLMTDDQIEEIEDEMMKRIERNLLGMDDD